MDDIICPECGRPNLGEAKKCWYCQTELTLPVSADREDTDPADVFNMQPDREETSEQDDDEEGVESEDLPEWLAKIRKKIEEERGPEEELPFWKQKDIFGGEKDVGKKSVKSNPQKKSSKKKTSKTEEKQTDLNEDADEQDQSELDREDLSDDLPAGFKKL